MTKPKAKTVEPVKTEVKKPYVAPEVKKVEVKAEAPEVKKVEVKAEAPLKTGKGLKAINSSAVCQLTRRADRTFRVTV